MNDNELMNQIRNELIEYGYNEQDIETSIKNVNTRLSWNIKSFCFIYSRKYKQWFNGKIINIFTNEETNEEWLVVEYNQNFKKKIQRFNQFVKPIVFDGNYNNKIVTFICNKLKENNEMTVDESIFKANKNECLASKLKEGDAINNCTYLNRICHAVQYYHVLSRKQDKKGRDQFIAFCMHTYHQCLDDYIHIISVHGNTLNNKICLELEEKYGLDKCIDLNKCQYTERHFGNRQRNKYHFYIELFDTLHVNINHLDTLGLRCYLSKYDNDKKQDDEQKFSDYSNCFDPKFNAMQKQIEAKRKKYNSKNIKRLQSNNNSKFNIAVIENETDNTFIDSMFIYLTKNGDDNKALRELNAFIVSEEFDTDCIVEETKYAMNDNYLLYVLNNNIKCITNINSFIKEYNLKNSSFTTGFIFWYWSWYQNVENQQQFHGYLVSELIVKQHFESIKSEALESGLITIFEFKKLVVEKARRYLFTKKCRKIKCIEKNDELHFGIKEGASITEKHLQSLLLYTDFTKFCSHFSATFHCIYFNENISSIKYRNSKYYNVSKSLRELVQYFGINGDDGEDTGCANGYEFGTFYCGMACELCIPELAIRFNGPSSTTKHIEIAMRLLGARGLILELNNKRYSSKKELFFDSSWISNYPEEDERIMFGGRWKLEIESVRLMVNKQNYQLFTYSFYLFDSILSGDWDDEGNDKISSINISIISRSISHYLNISSNSFDAYINDTFWLFLNNKTEIILNLDEMYWNIKNNDFVNIIMYSVKGYDYDDDIYIGFNNINIFKSLLFDLFPNGKEISIHTSSWEGYVIYPFNISYFLSNIIYSSSSLLTKSFKKIIIKAVVYTIGGQTDSWLSKAFDSMLQQEFSHKNINIHLKRTVNSKGNEDWLIIDL